jgi:hypothetical protein
MSTKLVGRGGDLARHMREAARSCDYDCHILYYRTPTHLDPSSLCPKYHHRFLQPCEEMKRTPSSRQKRARIKIDCYKDEPKYTDAGV